jgi:hypothetical protein
MRILLSIFTVIILLGSCKKEFSLPDTVADGSILVVEGDVLVGSNTENTFLLSRLKDLNKSDSFPETKARVEIVSAAGQKWLLPENKPGVYTAALSLPGLQSYFLKIQTADGKIYESMPQQVISTPEIDSVTWVQQDSEVRFSVHTHDPSNKTRYYRWNYRETWESHAWYETYFDFVNGFIVTRPPGDQIYACWKTEEANSIIIANSNSLSEDVISYQPVTTVVKPSEKMFVRYSILVRQLGLSKEAYDFWNILRKNTELTGTLFDPQPSNLPTNLKCTNDPSRTVIGFVSVGKLTEKRIFILHSALIGWPYRNESLGCTATERSKAQSEEFLRNNPGFLPAYFVTAGGGYGVARKECVDCRLGGGTNEKPLFW